MEKDEVLNLRFSIMVAENDKGDTEWIGKKVFQKFLPRIVDDEKDRITINIKSRNWMTFKRYQGSTVLVLEIDKSKLTKSDGGVHPIDVVLSDNSRLGETKSYNFFLSVRFIPLLEF